MARDLAIRVVVDNSQAVTNLGQVDRTLSAVTDSSSKASLATSALQTMFGRLSEVTGVTTNQLDVFRDLLDGGIVLGAGLAAAELIRLADSARVVGEEIERASLVTGIAIPAMSNLKFAVESTGGSLDQVTHAMFMFEQRMENSSETVDKGLRLIGLSLDAVEAMQPDQRFLAISEAMRAAGHDTNLAAAAFDIMGRQGRDMLPTLVKPLSDLAEQARLVATVSEADAKAAAEATLSLNTMGAAASAATTNLGLHVSVLTELSLILASTKLGAIQLVAGLVNMGEAYVTATTFQTEFRSGLPPVADGLRGLANGTGLAAKGLHDYYEAAKQWGGLQITMDIADEKAALRELEAGLHASEKAQREATKAAEDAMRAQAALDEVIWEAVKAEREQIAKHLELVEGTKPVILHTQELGQALLSVGTHLNMALLAAVPWTETLVLMPDRLGRTTVAVKAFGETLESSVIQTLNELPASVERAFAGGNWTRAITDLGARLGTDLSGAINAHLKIGVDPISGQQSLLGGLASGGIMAGISAGIGLLAKGLKALFGGPSQAELDARKTFAQFQQQFGSLDDTIKAVGASYARLGKTGVQAQHDLDMALQATHGSAADVAAALKTIQANLDEDNRRQQRATELVSEYKIAITDLGTKWNQQQLDAQAKKLIDDYQIMTTVLGVEAPKAIVYMHDNLQAFVLTALKTGTEIPDAMRPMLEQMVKMGTLTDENGNIITDLGASGVKFAKTMTEGFDQVTNAIKDLTRVLGGVPAVIGQIPRDISVHVGYKVDAPPDVGSGAGDQSYHQGGMVLPFVPRAHRGLAIDERVIVAQTGEGILNRGAMRRIGGAAGLGRLNSGGGAGGTVNLTVSFQGSLETVATQQRLAALVKKQFDQEMLGQRKVSAR